MRDVIVLGGGIAGTSTAFYLASDGVDVLLLEQGDIGSGASGANAGSLHGQLQHEPFVENGARWAQAFAPAIPFYKRSIELWLEASELLGTDLEAKQTGGIIVAATADKLRMIEAKTAFENAHGLPTEMLGRDDLRRLAPYIAERMIGGALCPMEGKASPLRAAPAYAQAAESAGAEVRTRQRVIDIEKSVDGFSVRTADNMWQARRLVIAAGIDSVDIAAKLGVELQIAAVPIQLTVTEPVAPLMEHLLYSAEDVLTLKQSARGTLLIGGGWPAVMDSQGRAQVAAESLSRNLAAALAVVPALARLQVVRSWAWPVNITESWLPILGEVGGVPGLFVNHVPAMGFTGGPASGLIVASQVQGKPPPVDFDVLPFVP